MRSFAVEGTVFLLAVSALSGVGIAYYPGSPFSTPAFFLVPVAIAVIHIVVAYFCWNLSSWSFIAAMALALFVGATDVVYSNLRYPGDELLVILQVLIILFSYRGYREIRKP
ncbi:MAG: hypothetical protein ACE5IB_04295 [Candidatus Geothermarchaeales archaeon]